MVRLGVSLTVARLALIVAFLANAARADEELQRSPHAFVFGAGLRRVDLATGDVEDWLCPEVETTHIARFHHTYTYLVVADGQLMRLGWTDGEVLDAFPTNDVLIVDDVFSPVVIEDDQSGTPAISHLWATYSPYDIDVEEESAMYRWAPRSLPGLRPLRYAFNQELRSQHAGTGVLLLGERVASGQPFVLHEPRWRVSEAPDIPAAIFPPAGQVVDVDAAVRSPEIRALLTDDRGGRWLATLAFDDPEGVSKAVDVHAGRWSVEPIELPGEPEGLLVSNTGDASIIHGPKGIWRVEPDAPGEVRVLLTVADAERVLDVAWLVSRVDTGAPGRHRVLLALVGRETSLELLVLDAVSADVERSFPLPGESQGTDPAWRVYGDAWCWTR